MTQQNELTLEEIEKAGEDAFKEDALLDHYVNTRGHWERVAPFIAKAQDTKTRQATLREVLKELKSIDQNADDGRDFDRRVCVYIKELEQSLKERCRSEITKVPNS